MNIDERDELEVELRKHKLDSLLLLIADKSREMFNKGESLETITWNRRIGGLTESFNQLMLIWGLADLSYRAIKCSNDYRAQESKLDDLFKLNNLLAKVTDQEAGRRSSIKITEQAKVDIFVGLPQTQFWWQDIARNRAGIVYHFLRYYLLLREMPNYFPDLKHPDKDLQEITGFGIDDFSKLLFACYALLLTAPSSEFSIINVDVKVTQKNPVVTSDNIKKCLSFFTADYLYYRQETHPNNPLFFRPVIQTQSKRLIVANAFLFIKKFYEGIYWIIRDKYMQNNSQDFTNAFGHYYEKYIESLLSYYLKPGVFQKIGNDKGGADWIVYTDKYRLIIEQKSSLMSVKLKKEYPSLEELDKYLVNFNKACAQLRKTNNAIKENNRITVNLILHFEKLYFKEAFVKKELLKLGGNDFDQLRNYYLIDTEEFEQLIQVLSEDTNAVNEILDSKIAYEDNPPSPQYGQDFFDILKMKRKFFEVKFLEKYRPIFDNLIVS
jgi:hypothetical protein